MLWPLEKIKEGLENFKNKYGRYPTAPEINLDIHLPNTRYIERHFGGVVKLRQILGFDVVDFSQGQPREFARQTLKRANKSINELYQLLVINFGKMRVHREFMIDYTNNMRRCDFYIFLKEKEPLIVECFYPTTFQTFTGCLNLKQKKYQKIDEKIIYVNMNNDLDPIVCQSLIKKKKNQFRENESLVNLTEFTEFCKSMV